MKIQLIIKRTALRVHQSLTVGNPPTALVHQVRQVRQEREGVIIKCKLTDN